MKKLMITLVAAAALAVPATASAHHGRHGDHARFGARLTAAEHGKKLGWWKHGALFAKLTGTGATFGGTTAGVSGTLAGRPLASGTFGASLSTDWSKATANERGGSCAPSTATVTLVDAASSANTVVSTATGKTCSVGSNDRNVAYVFFGKADTTSSTGALSGVTGSGRVLLVQKTDGSVTGYELVGIPGDEHALVRFAKHEAHHAEADNDGD